LNRVRPAFTYGKVALAKAIMFELRHVESPVSWCSHIELAWRPDCKQNVWRSGYFGFEYIPENFMLCPICGARRPAEE
jgi:hypothetical protein